jgi:hypothetical protein
LLLLVCQLLLLHRLCHLPLPFILPPLLLLPVSVLQALCHEVRREVLGALLSPVAPSTVPASRLRWVEGCRLAAQVAELAAHKAAHLVEVVLEVVLAAAALKPGVGCEEDVVHAQEELGNFKH